MNADGAQMIWMDSHSSEEEERSGGEEENLLLWGWKRERLGVATVITTALTMSGAHSRFRLVGLFTLTDHPFLAAVFGSGLFGMTQASPALLANAREVFWLEA